MMLSFKKETCEEIIHYKFFIKLKNLIFQKSPNIILYGASKSGKTFLINYILKNIYGESKHINDNNFSYKENINYYFFDFSKNQKNLMIDKIKFIVNNYDYFNDIIKYIVIDNFNHSSDIIQKTIKVFLEKYYLNSRFIFITNNIGSLQRSIKGNCFNIKLPLPNKYDKYIYFKYKFDKYNIKYNDFLLLKNCEKFNIDHIFKLYYEDVSYNNIYYKVINEIYYLMIIPFNINKIKTLSMKIKELNLDISIIFLKLLDYLTINSLIIKEFAHYNYIITKSYRDIIHIESVLVSLYKIINYG